MSNLYKSKRIALIAAEGILPVEVARTLQKQSIHYHVFGIKGYAKSSDYQSSKFTELPLGKLRNLKRILKTEELTHVCLAGGVKRPKWSQLRFDIEGWLFAKQLFLNNNGDDALLKRLIETVKDRYSKKIIAPSDIVCHWTIKKTGNLTAKKPSLNQLNDVNFARKLLAILSPFDIGQGLVILNERILAIEDFSGTDDLINRVKKQNFTGAILVKASKLNQSRDIDLPAIGINTVVNAYLAGFSGIAIESKNSFILESQKLIEKADKLNIFIYAMPAIN